MRKFSCAAAAVILLASLSSTARAVGTTFAIDIRSVPHRLITFPANAPALNVTSANAGYNGFAIDFDASATTLYGVNGTAAPFSFGSINQTTGNFTSIGVTALPAGENPTGLSCDPNGTMYLSTNSTAGNFLYTVNLGTGVPSLVGAITGVTGLLDIDIAISRGGQMYGHDIASDNLLTINKATGAAALIGPTGQAANFAQGMDFDWDTDTLYATIYTGGGTGVYASFNLATGAAIPILSTTPWNAEMEMAINSPIPEPASLSLLGIGALGLISRRRR